MGYLSSYFVVIFLYLDRVVFFQVDGTTFNENGRTIELPSSLEQFRMNLVELLVDICQLLGPTLFLQKVMIAYFILEHPSFLGCYENLIMH